MTREQAMITAGVMLALAVSALDTTVVGTAMPTIIGQLGGLSEYSWVFSGYLLAATTTVPLYAKLADVHGRKPIFMLGLALFVGGSALCGLSRSMIELIGFRALQGVGAGALQPIAFTIVGDIFSPTQRARVQGLFSSVWGVSAILGPAIGGVLTQTVGWPWVFELNIPVGIVAAVVIGRTLHERFERRRHRIDWLGAILLTAGVGLLLFVFSEAGELYGWGSPPFLALLAASIALLVAFVRVERTTREPIVDLALVGQPLIAAGLAISIVAGVILYGQTTFVPPMIQGVLGGSPIDAGAVVAAMSFSWPVGAIIGGRAVIRLGARPVVLVGTISLVVGSVLVTQIGRVGTLWFAVLGSGITGFGMGLAATTILIVIQAAVDWGRRGVATGLVQFSRTIGGAVGVGLMGGILAAFVGNASSAVLNPRLGGSSGSLASARDALATGLFWIYVLLLGVSVLALAIAVRAMPAVRVDASAIDRGATPSVGRTAPITEPQPIVTPVSAASTPIANEADERLRIGPRADDQAGQGDRDGDAERHEQGQAWLQEGRSARRNDRAAQASAEGSAEDIGELHA
jgi:EmrB/QacA subfamily drug resistance transporter